jgi:hypothetical protein
LNPRMIPYVEEADVDDSIPPIRGRTYACGVDAEAEDTCDHCPDPDGCIDESYRRAANDLHPTVEACKMRSFCDATFEAAERRSRIIGVLLERVHASEMHAGPLQGCSPCGRLMEEAGRA